MTTHPHNPFGSKITAEDIIDTLSFFDTWEERYKYIIDLGKELPEMDARKKTEERLVRGCQSQVWIDSSCVDGKLWFDVDSDAFIVKGLLGVVLAVFNGRSPSDIVDYNVDQYFENLGLLKHLSPSRGNGLRAMVSRIKSTAAELN